MKSSYMNLKIPLFHNMKEAYILNHFWSICKKRCWHNPFRFNCSNCNIHLCFLCGVSFFYDFNQKTSWREKTNWRNNVMALYNELFPSNLNVTLQCWQWLIDIKKEKIHHAIWLMKEYKMIGSVGSQLLLHRKGKLNLHFLKQEHLK